MSEDIEMYLRKTRTVWDVNDWDYTEFEEFLEWRKKSLDLED